MRYLTPYLLNDLKKKMILLSGPRQTGKTTLAKSLIKENSVYLNWDIRSDQKIIRDASWDKDASLVVLDELHKYLKWKNYLKGISDQFKNKPPVLVTGSAKLETFRHEGDALTGRYFHYRLHPIDTAEATLFFPENKPEASLKRLLETGGFPEAFLNPEDAERLRNDRFDFILQEDLRDLSKSNSIRGIKLLIEILREQAGGQINYAGLSARLGVSAVTAKAWIDLLERLYVIFRVHPYSGELSRSLKKEPKIYFYDCASGYPEHNGGAILENAVACSLLKFCHFKRDIYGKRMDLMYFRDREKREVDFVITLNNKPLWCIEVKTGKSDLSPSLLYLHIRMKPKASFQLVLNLDNPLETKGIRILPLANWLNKLYETEL